MKARVLRHVPFEHLGVLGPLLEQRRVAIETIDVPTAGLARLDALDSDLLIVLGGPIGAGDGADFPFLDAEIEHLERRLAARMPTLGICLGAQLMARALGARVRPAPRREIGWAPVALTAAGQSGCLGHLGHDSPTVLHWHGDNADLPAGAERLAYTDACPNQAFAWGDHALGLQFHLEARPADIEAWLVGHVVEIGQTRGVSVAGLRGDTARFGPTLAARAPAVFDDWLDRCGLGSPAGC